MDADGTDIDQVMRWNERLRLLAQLQGSYNELLQENGFASEESFNLVRDWSHRAWDWTFRETGPAFPELPGLATPEEGRRVSHDLDPSHADPAEPYLILLDPPEDMDEPTGGADEDRRAA
jgi:hypothetical protein